MRITLIGLCLVALPLFAQDQDPGRFRNDREGKSYFWSNAAHRTLSRALQEFSGEELKHEYREAFRKLDSKLCVYDLNRELNASLLARSPRFSDYEGVIHYLRSQDEIDDVVAKLLLEAHKTRTTAIDFRKTPAVTNFSRRKIADVHKLLNEFPARLERNCYEDAYRGLVADIRAADPNISSIHLEALFIDALEKRKISRQLYITLEQARANDIGDGRISLRGYGQKLRSLRTNRPLRDPRERSDFVTERFDGERTSRRIRLMENYTDVQIMIMGEMIRTFRRRLEAPRVDIVEYDDQGRVVDVRTLGPMERFRYAIRVLRGEMQRLSLNANFQGRMPDYMDLMVAAYEVSIIPAIELDQLAALEQIWNPRTTFWDKAQTWVQSLSGVATIVIPAPYGFVPALALVVIEMINNKNQRNDNDPTSLF
jgi:hypothetical protein